MTVSKLISDLRDWLIKQRFNPGEGSTKGDRNYRTGWNDAMTHIRRQLEIVDATLRSLDKPGG